MSKLEDVNLIFKKKCNDARDWINLTGYEDARDWINLTTITIVVYLTIYGLALSLIGILFRVIPYLINGVWKPWSIAAILNIVIETPYIGLNNIANYILNLNVIFSFFVIGMLVSISYFLAARCLILLAFRYYWLTLFIIVGFLIIN